MKVVIIGAKNPETRRMIDSIIAAGNPTRMEFFGFLDNDKSRQHKNFVGLPVFGGFELVDQLIEEGCLFINTITGSTLARYETSKMVSSKGGKFVNFIHPSVNTPEKIGVGNYIQEDVKIQAAVEIGDNSSIHVSAIIAHQCKVGNSTFIAHAVSVSGEVTIGDGVFVGTNASILPTVKVGNWATIGAGAVVLKDVPDYAVVVGNPGKVIRENERRYPNGAI
jgi:sugar O-acyltransferase (sialic acid O-acetyltransferase NeuD family)